MVYAILVLLVIVLAEAGALVWAVKARKDVASDLRIAEAEIKLLQNSLKAMKQHEIDVAAVEKWRKETEKKADEAKTDEEAQSVVADIIGRNNARVRNKPDTKAQ